MLGSSDQRPPARKRRTTGCVETGALRLSVESEERMLALDRFFPPQAMDGDTHRQPTQTDSYMRDTHRCVTGSDATPRQAAYARVMARPPHVVALPCLLE